MADYTLSIRILDEDLDKQIKKLQSIFKNINIDGTGNHSNSKDEKALKASDKLIEAINDMGKGAVAPKLEKQESMMQEKEDDTGEADRDEKMQKESISAFTKIKDILGNIDQKQVALTGMSLGIGAILGTLTDISPMIQSTFKLLSTGIMLMLKPIADFIGLLLRPIMVLLLQYVILPFYKSVYPWFAATGKNLGDWLINGSTTKDESGVTQINYHQPIFQTTEVKNAFKPLTDILNKIGSDIKSIFGNIGKFFQFYLIDPIIAAGAIFMEFIANIEQIPAQIGVAWNKLTTWINDEMILPIQEAWTGLTTWINEEMIQPVQDAWNNFTTLFTDTFSMEGVLEAWNNITGFFIGASEGVVTFLTSSWYKIATFWLKTGQEAATSVTDAWEATTKFFSILSSDVNTWLKDRWESITKFFANMSSDVTGWLKDAWDSITNFFINMLNSLADIWNSVTSLFSRVKAKSSSGGGGANDYATNSKIYKNLHSATGNIINEKVVGTGQETGATYTIGEAGAEAITPIKDVGNMGGGRPITINMTVNDPAQVNAIIARIKQELLLDQNRAGII